MGGSHSIPQFRVPTLHVYLDEAGDFNFRPNGSPYYVFAVAWTMDPSPLAHDLARLRYALLKQGHDLTSFHASEDKQRHRDAVVEVLRRHANWRFAAVVVDKGKVNPSIRDQHSFYPQFGTMALRFVFRGWTQAATSVLAFTDTLPINKRRAAVAAAFRRSCRADLHGLPFNIYHHPQESNYWLQLVDYCCWAVQRKWTKGDSRTYDALAHRLAKPELNVLQRGETRYY